MGGVNRKNTLFSGLTGKTQNDSVDCCVVPDSKCKA